MTKIFFNRRYQSCSNSLDFRSRQGTSRYSIKYGAEVLNARQRNYSQIKRELWGMYTALKNDRHYFQGAEVI